MMGVEAPAPRAASTAAAPTAAEPLAAPDPWDLGAFGPDAVWWNGTGYRAVLSQERTGGAMSITDSLSPAGSGPPRHVHGREDETFVVLSGRHRFWIAGETVERGPGEAVFIPRGTEHTFEVTGEEPGRHLVVLTPAGFEAFFAEMAEGGHRIPEDMARIDEAAARHGMRFTGPPLAADG